MIRRTLAYIRPVSSNIGIYLTVLVGLIALSAAGAQASPTLCVNQQGSHNCYSTIQAAINAVGAVDTTIIVQPGTYTVPSCAHAACSVAEITSGATNASELAGLTLECGNGRKHRSVVLDATNLDHAVYVSGVNGVTVEGCVAQNADREGILVENASDAHVMNNIVTNNDQSMAQTIGSGAPPCPTFLAPGTAGAIQCCPDADSGGPGNFPDDNDDCGEGIHLRSVTDSVVQGNLVHNNIGGILMTDETGPNKDNIIVGNNSSDNTEFGGDCGVTLASHLACAPGSTDATGCTPVTSGSMFNAGYGVTDNAVIGNVLNGNGASGTGAFANPGIPPGAETEASDNLIANNIVKNNGQPGIAIHVHAANGSADDNTIIGNIVSGNGGDGEAIPTSTPKMGIEVLSNGSFGNGFSSAEPISGTKISQNKISNEGVDVWIGNTATSANVYLNDLAGHGAIGVDNGGNATVEAPVNWWGCPHGPGKGGCSSASGMVETNPFLSHPVHPSR